MVNISWRPVIYGIPLTVLLFVFGALFSAGGHNFTLMMMLFPWAILLGILLPQFAWWLPFVMLVLLQFPTYVLVPGLIGGGKRTFWITVSLIALIHILGVVWCFVVDSRESWRILFRW